MNRKQAASALGVTDRQLGNWRKESWFPADAVSGNQWDVKKIERARDEHGRKGSQASNLNQQLTLAIKSEQLRQERVNSRRLEMSLAKEEGKLIPREAFETFVVTVLSQLRRLQDQLPDLVVSGLTEEMSERVRESLKRELLLWTQQTRQTIDDETRKLDGEGQA